MLTQLQSSRKGKGTNLASEFVRKRNKFESLLFGSGKIVTFNKCMVMGRRYMCEAKPSDVVYYTMPRPCGSRSC